MSKFLLVTGDNCPYCDKAREMLKGHTVVEKPLDEFLGILGLQMGHRTVPQIYQFIGGASDLEKLLEAE